MLSETLLLLSAFLVVGTAYEAPEIVGDLSLLGVPFDELPVPADPPFRLSNNGFVEKQDFWLRERNLRSKKFRHKRANSCSVSLSVLGEHQPVYVSGGAMVAPTGTTGMLYFSVNQKVTAACPGGHLITNKRKIVTEQDVMCTHRNLFSSPGWLSNTIRFQEILCDSHPKATETSTVSCEKGGTLITVGFVVTGKTYTLLKSCFLRDRAEVLYVLHEQNPENLISQTGGNRVSFRQGAFFPNLDVNTLYGLDSQKSNFDSILGPGMSLKYFRKNFLNRGHMAARQDFILPPAQGATFTYINVVPQWKSFNGGNWEILERELRKRINIKGSRTQIYTGTWGILKLPNNKEVLTDIYLSASTKQIPVPLWVYKVVYEPSTNKGIAFLGLNNPFASEAEARKLVFCTDVCNRIAYRWIGWNPLNMKKGFSLCCDVNDFSRTVNSFPRLRVNGLFS